ncbi:DJ-1/PfpI family protein [Streptomyces coelicoflavus]|uniref:DJ-1/PfpI family protein n=1 Tax=Streptomyces TaxID=1883 RepID=UPI001291E717|nr:DJ-1/PfpI family protein [Streptomyces sp. SYP-A7193]QFX86648.1 DJ-1/PfpI family protein [Streptomyces sp. SYP-A7193]
MPDTLPYRVTVLLFDGVEELDAFGPWETLRFWQELTDRDVVVRTASLDGGPVRCSLGLAVTPDGAVDDSPRPDLLIHPGGSGIDQLRKDEAHLARMRSFADAGTLLASVCNGALVLAAAGLLAGLPATSHWSVLDDLASFPDVEVRTKQRWVDAGHIVTSAGISAGIDMALHLVARVEGAERAREVAHVLEYAWADDTNPPE